MVETSSVILDLRRLESPANNINYKEGDASHKSLTYRTINKGL
jgi:hypothetical protein